MKSGSIVKKGTMIEVDDKTEQTQGEEKSAVNIINESDQSNDAEDEDISAIINKKLKK